MSSVDYIWFSLSLRITGKGLAFDRLNRDLGLTPTFSVREGELVRPSRRIRAEQDVWIYDIARKSEKPLNELMKEAQDLLQDRAEVIRSLSPRHSVALWCSYQTNMAQGGFDVEPSTLAFLAAAGVTLTVSILSAGETKDSRRASSGRAD